MQVADQLHAFRTSDCSTFHLRSPHGGDPDCFRGIDNGYSEAGAAISLADETYTGARVMVTNNAMPVPENPVEDFRFAVWDYETKALRATSDNLVAAINAAPRNTTSGGTGIPDGGYTFQGDFLEPIELREGEWTLLGISLYGEYAARNINIVNGVCQKPMMMWEPQLGFNRKSDVVAAQPPDGYPTGDYEGGVPGPIGTEPSGNFPAMDLLTESVGSNHVVYWEMP